MAMEPELQQSVQEGHSAGLGDISVLSDDTLGRWLVSDGGQCAQKYQVGKEVSGKEEENKRKEGREDIRMLINLRR